MANKAKRRRSSSRLYETEPNFKQVRLPVPKRTIKDKHPVWSAPSKYQQTITQMNPFYTIFHPDSEDDELESDEGQTQNYVASPIGRKRRKTAPESPPLQKMETRSSARKAVKTEPVMSEKQSKQKPVYGKRKSALVTFRTPTELMPPPKTPKAIRQREIPSSQSPADSPLSTQKQVTPLDYRRSPLKEKSTNPIISTPTSRKVPRWAKKLEVADSYENDENESCVATPSTVMKRGKASNTLSQRLGPGQNFKSIQTEPSVENDGTKVVSVSSQNRKTRSHTDGRIRADMVLDTDIEDDNDDEEDEDQANFDVDTIPASFPEDKTLPEISDTDEVLSSTAAQASDSRSHINMQNRADKAPSSKNPDDDLLTHDDPRSDSQEASAQLHNDLCRVTGPGGLQTESQYENAWASYHPAAISKSSSPLEIPSSAPHELSDPVEIPSSAPHERSDPAPNTVPTQILSPANPFKRPPATPLRRNQPVPPSQATTTDATQSSPRRMPSSSSLAMPSSPPPMPPPMSSSSSNRALDPWAGYEWNGVRLTDSQLLPESLLNDSVGGPPGSWQFEVEELEEE